MNKTDFIAAISEKENTTRANAERMFNAVMGVIGDTLASGDPISLVGFGNFTVVDRAARTGRNPQTGKPMNIPAKKTIRFKAGKKLVDAVQK